MFNAIPITKSAKHCHLPRNQKGRTLRSGGFGLKQPGGGPNVVAFTIGTRSWDTGFKV